MKGLMATNCVSGQSGTQHSQVGAFPLANLQVRRWARHLRGGGPFGLGAVGAAAEGRRVHALLPLSLDLGLLR